MLKHMLHMHMGAAWLMPAALGVTVAAVGGAGYWGYMQIDKLTTETHELTVHVAALESTLSSTTLELQAGLSSTQSSFSERLAQERAAIEDKVGDISSTVGTLEKLSKTDPELLQKYSKIFFLNENYAPERVEQIPQKYVYSETRAETILAQVEPFLEDMLSDAKREGVELYVASAYRSFDEQRALKGIYTVTYGAGTANQFSADQGYSEHQLGTAVDLITTGLGGQLTDAFANTEAYQWLLDNAYKYGFTLSYPQGNAYYIYEPWHWRFVGVELATYLHKKNKHFYDLDQRDIDTYLANIFDD